jgi:drug/metabolite transporter (DMT)-like permease
MLLALSAIWGASFMFIKVGVRELDPITLVWARLTCGALTLAPVVVLTHGVRATLETTRREWLPLVVTGLLNSSIPFWSLSWAETRIDSGLAAVIQAAAPLFTAVLALRFAAQERVTGSRLLGVVIGFAGVALLVGVQPRGEVLAALGVVFSALCYAIAALYTARTLAHVSPLVTALGAITAAALSSLPLALFRLPSAVPELKVTGSVLALGVGGTGIAYVLYYALLAGAGASRSILVTYLVPALALGYGALILDEPVTAAALGGLALILAGVALGTGTVRLRRRYARGVIGRELLDEHVARFNAGVRTGEWAPMLELFTDDAELVFEDVPVGPFAGRDAIAAAYREQPPDDTIEVHTVEERGHELVVPFAWSRGGTGRLTLTREGDRIARLVVAFDS